MKGLFFTYSLTYAGAVVYLFYPFIGLLVYICFSIIKPPAMWYWSGLFPPPMGVGYDQIVAIAMLMGWVIKGTGDWKLGRGTAVTLCLVLFWLWGVVGWACSDVPALAWVYVITQTKTVLPFLVGVTLIDSVSRLKQLAWVMALSQGYLAYELNMSYYAGYNRVAREGFANMDNNCVAIAMATGVGLALFLGISERRVWLKALAFLSAVLMAHTVMFAWSRGGMLGLIVAALVSFFLVPRKSSHYLYFILLLLLGWRLAGDQVRDRFMTVFVDPEERDASSESRLEYWGYCLDTMKKSPLLGCGPGHWPEECRRRNVKLVYGHSLWLQCGADTGVPGLALLVAFYGVCVVRLWPMTRRRAKVPDPWLPHVARMVIASLAGFVVAGCFVSLVGLELPYYVVMLGAGALKVASFPQHQPVPGPYPEEPRWQTEPALAGRL